MPNIRQIRNHISAVDSARTITKALQMIAASRLQRVQRRRVASRAAAAGAEEIAAALIHITADSAGHPLLREGTSDVSRVIVIGSDRGMCGGYNSRVVQAAIEAGAELTRLKRKLEYHAIGSRAAAALRDRMAAWAGAAPVAAQPGFEESRMFDEVGQLADRLRQEFETGRVGAVCLVRMRLGGQGAMTAATSQLLPLEAGPVLLPTYAPFEPLPRAEAVLDVAVSLVLRMRLYEAFLEAALSEHAARLMAMKAATTSAEDMIRDLTQAMNRARQARITSELSEIIGGADAVEGVR